MLIDDDDRSTLIISMAAAAVCSALIGTGMGVVVAAFIWSY